MNRRALLAAATLLGLLAIPHRHASAQIAVGGSLGRVFDTQQDWLVLGAEARADFKEVFEFNPRFTYNHAEGGSTTQLDANVLYRPALAGKAQFRPFIGAGLAIVHVGFTGASETKVGANAAFGVDMERAGSKLRPFLHGEYTAVKDFGNLYTLAVGVVYQVK